MVLFLTMLFTKNIAAHNFRDIDEHSVSYEAIIEVAELGIITGDLSGNFNPNGLIDKFETMRILARMADFDTYTHVFGDALNERYQQVLLASQSYQRWNNSVNREIAYLLYLGVIISSDLSNFIVLDNGEERLRALSREEAAVFMVRFMGRSMAALRMLDMPRFNDDKAISLGARPHLYYMYNLGFITDNNGFIRPREGALRADMAVMVRGVLGELQNNAEALPSLTQPTLSTSDILRDYRVIEGIIYKVNLEQNAVSIQRRFLSLSGEIVYEITTHSFAEGAAITRNSQLIDIQNIANGDFLIAMLYSNYIYALDLQGRQRNINGILLEKDFTSNANLPRFIVQDTNGTRHSLQVLQSSTITRQGVLGIAARQVRIGDTVEVFIDGHDIITLNATGFSSVIEGYIRDIFITMHGQSYIVISQTPTGANLTRHLIIDGAVNIYALTLGSRVRIWLDSQEIQQLEILQQANFG